MLDGSSTSVKSSSSPADKMTNCQAQSSERHGACNRNANSDKFAVTCNNKNSAIIAAVCFCEILGATLCQQVCMQKYLKVPWYSPFSDIFSSQLQWSSFAWSIIHETAQGKKNARFLAFCWNWCWLEPSNNFVRWQKQGMTSHNQRLAGGEAWLRNLCPVRHYKRSNFQKSVLWRRHSESRPKKKKMDLSHRWGFAWQGRDA